MEETHDLFLLTYRCYSYNIVIYNNIIEVTKSVGETGYNYVQNKMLAVYYFGEKGTELIAVNDERGFSSNLI